MLMIQRALDCLVRKRAIYNNCSKTEIININNENVWDCVINARIVQQMERFKYLRTPLLKDGFF